MHRPSTEQDANPARGDRQRRSVIRGAIVRALLVAFLLTFCWGASAETTPPLQGGELSAASGQIGVKVLVAPLGESVRCRSALSWRWGAEGACPATVVGGVEVKVGPHAAFVPLSAFADLGNPRRVKIEEREGKGRFAVILQGGDAAISYKAELEFRMDVLLERVVRHGEFPAEAWEKTTYKFNRAD